MSVSGIYLLWKHSMLRITANRVNKTGGIHILIVPVNTTAILFPILLLLYTRTTRQKKSKGVFCDKAFKHITNFLLPLQQLGFLSFSLNGYTFPSVFVFIISSKEKKIKVQSISFTEVLPQQILTWASTRSMAATSYLSSPGKAASTCFLKYSFLWVLLLLSNQLIVSRPVTGIFHLGANFQCFSYLNSAAPPAWACKDGDWCYPLPFGWVNSPPKGSWELKPSNIPAATAAKYKHRKLLDSVHLVLARSGLFLLLLLLSGVLFVHLFFVLQWGVLLWLGFGFFVCFDCKYCTLNSPRLCIPEEVLYSSHFSQLTDIHPQLMDILFQLQNTTLYECGALTIQNQLSFICKQNTALPGHSTDFVCKRTAAKKY